MNKKYYYFIICFIFFNSALFAKELSNVELGLKKAVSFQGTPHQIQEVYGVLKRKESLFVFLRKIKKTLGKDNLSTFIIQISPDDCSKYKITPLNRNNNIIKIFARMSKGESLISLDDLGKIKYIKRTADEILGTIHIKNRFWEIDCVFKSKKIFNNWSVVTLVIADRKQSDKIEEGLIVFDKEGKIKKEQKKIYIDERTKEILNNKVKSAALKQAIEFQASTEEIKKTGEFIDKYSDKLGPLMFQYLKLKLGVNNLSTFVFYVKNPMGYEFDYLGGNDPFECGNKISDLMKSGQSLVELNTLRNIIWNENNERASGSFIWFREGMYKAKFLFVAKNHDKWEITKLAMAKKGSNNINEGMLVFENGKINKIKYKNALEDILNQIKKESIFK